MASFFLRIILVMPLSIQLSDKAPLDANDIEHLNKTEPNWPQLLGANKLLISGHFNGAIIAIAQLDTSANPEAKISNITVRDITRRRGVCRQLITLLQKQLPQEFHSISTDLKEHPELEAFFSSMGFTPKGNIWQWQR